jgi:XisH protein
MAAKDIYHDQACNALLKDGRIITDDPLVLSWGPRDYLVDRGAEKLMAAEKGDQRIAVEVKSFVGPSPIEDLKVALGQFVLYHDNWRMCNRNVLCISQSEPKRSRSYLKSPWENCC